jgi:alcohol dehydrogenase class IV
LSSFLFETVPRVVCRQGGSSFLGEHLANLGVTHAFIVTDPTICDSGMLSPALTSLAKLGLKATVYREVQADPPEHGVLAAVDAALAAGVDGVVGFGGGSSMDTAKLVALMCRSNTQLSDIYGVDRVQSCRLPLVQIPTTAGTGSEVTPIAIVTTPSQEKKGVSSRVLLPDIALLDSQLTLGMPARLTAMTGIDAIVHAIEAYTSRLKRNPISDALSTGALKLLLGNIKRVLAGPDDAEARQAMLLGSLLAGMAFANAPVGAVHALAYPLGGRFHVPHGLSNALMLPHVLAFNLPAAQAAYADLADVLKIGGATTAERAEGFVALLSELVREMPFEQSLRAVGVVEADLDELAIDAMNVQRLLVNNPREVTLQDARIMYQQALEASPTEPTLGALPC